MGISRAERSEDVDASPEACFDVASDYETFPRWQSAVESTAVLEREGDGVASLVRTEIDAKLRRVAYTLRYHHERPRRIWWELVEGEGVEAIEGEYVFAPLDQGSRTRVTYRLGIDAGVPMPGLVAKRLTKGVMGRSVEDLRDEVERRRRA